MIAHSVCYSKYDWSVITPLAEITIHQKQISLAPREAVKYVYKYRKFVLQYEYKYQLVHLLEGQLARKKYCFGNFEKFSLLNNPKL